MHPREYKDRNSSEQIGFVSYARVLVPGETITKGWVLSTGATVHVCDSRDKFEDYRPLSGKHVELITGSRADVAGIGSVTLRFTSGKTVTLSDVLHIPSSIQCFVSVGKLDAQGFQVILDFGSEKGMIYKNNKFVGNACVRGGDFLLNVENDGPSTSVDE